MMYGKIFDSMYDGTISANWQGLVTFQQMIVLCDADGVIDMTPPALSRRTGIPLEIIEKGIAYLEAPDPYSRTQGYDGARIVRIDEHRPWGWFIVNHDKYKTMQDADHIRAENRRRKRKQRAKDAQNVTGGHSGSRHTDKDKNKEKDIYAQIPGFCAWWNIHPRKKDKSRSAKAWISKGLEKRAKEVICKLQDQIENCESFDRPLNKIAHPTTYLNNDRFDDDIEPKQSNQSSGQSKSAIIDEVKNCINRGHHNWTTNGFNWTNDMAKQVFDHMANLPGGRWNFRDDRSMTIAISNAMQEISE